MVDIDLKVVAVVDLKAANLLGLGVAVEWEQRAKVAQTYKHYFSLNLVSKISIFILPATALLEK